MEHWAGTRTPEHDGAVRVLYVGGTSSMHPDVPGALEAADERLSVVSEPDARRGLDRLAAEAVDCIVSDHALPETDGLAFLDAVREGHPDVPFLLCPVSGSEAVASRAISAGVTDYLPTGEVGEQCEALADRILEAVDERRWQRPREALEAAEEGIGVLDGSGRFTHVNGAFAELYGYDPDELVGERWELIYREDVAEMVREEVFPTVAAGDRWEGETVGLRADGSTVAVEQTLSATADGGLVCTVRDITERRGRQRRLQYYRQAVECSTNMLAAADREYDLLFANRNFREFHGLGETDIAELSLSDALGDDALAKLEPYIDRVLEGEQVEYETTRPGPDGRERRLNIRGYPLEAADGTITGAMAAMRDVTGKYERRERLRRLSESRRVMSEINKELVRTTDTERMLATTTDILSSSDLFGCTFVSLLDGSTPEFVCHNGSELADAGADSVHTEAYVEAVLDRGLFRIDDVTEPPFAHHPGDHTSHAGLGVTISHEDDTFGVLTVHFPAGEQPGESEIRLVREAADDIGFFLHSRAIDRERRERAREVREQKQRYESLFDSIRDAILVADTDRRIVDCNPAFTELFGYDLSEIEGESPRRLCASEADYESIVQRLGAAGDDGRAFETVEYQKKSGQAFPGETTVFPLRDSEGETAGFVGLVRDVSDREDRLQQMQVIDRVLRHNLRNDLNVIEGFAETIRKSASGEIAENAGRILEASESFSTTADKERKITTFLSDPPARKTLDLVPVLEAIVATARERFPAAEIRLDCPASCRATTTRAIHRAISELVENAIEHADGDHPSVTVRVACGTELVEIEVADDGPGIPEMERAVLTGETEVEPLYHGSGLGLWLVNLIVRHSDGAVEFAAHEPRGSVVTIRLPAP